MSKKPELDEMQKLKELKIARTGFILALILLPLSLVIQSFMRADLRQMGFESVITLILSVYLIIAHVKNGLWDFDPRNKLFVVGGSVIAAVIGGLMYVAYFTNEAREHIGILITVVVATFVFTLLVILLVFRLMKKRRVAIDSDEEE